MSPPRASEADDDDGTPQVQEQGGVLLAGVHMYNSTEKPVRSAMRPSMEGRSPGQYSRKSSSGLSSVGFNVNVNAPEAETSHSSFTGANSISLKKIVDMFYDKVLADTALAPFFENINMQKLKMHQVRFMGLAFGGKDLVFEEDPNLNLRKVHYHLIRDKGLSMEHWEKFVGLFEKTLIQLEREIPEETREAAKRSIHATKHYFVPIGQETEYTNSSIVALPTDAA
jgi:hemoglobin